MAMSSRLIWHPAPSGCRKHRSANPSPISSANPLYCLGIYIYIYDIKLYYISYVSNIKTKKASGSRNWFNFGPQFRSIHFFWLQETSGSWGSHCRPQRPPEENETSPAVNQNIFGHDYLSCIGIGVCIHSTMCLYSKISQRGMWSYVYRILKLYSSSHTLN